MCDRGVQNEPHRQKPIPTDSNRFEPIPTDSNGFQRISMKMGSLRGDYMGGGPVTVFRSHSLVTRTRGVGGLEGWEDSIGCARPSKPRSAPRHPRQSQHPLVCCLSPALRLHRASGMPPQREGYEVHGHIPHGHRRPRPRRPAASQRGGRRRGPQLLCRGPQAALRQDAKSSEWQGRCPCTPRGQVSPMPGCCATASVAVPSLRSWTGCRRRSEWVGVGWLLDCMRGVA